MIDNITLEPFILWQAVNLQVCSTYHLSDMCYVVLMIFAICAVQYLVLITQRHVLCIQYLSPHHYVLCSTILITNCLQYFRILGNDRKCSPKIPSNEGQVTCKTPPSCYTPPVTSTASPRLTLYLAFICISCINQHLRLYLTYII